jgi:hypothetical protein
MPSLEYIAGFFDGEGSVSIYQPSKSKKPTLFQMSASLCQKVENASLLLELKAKYGGGLTVRRNSRTNPRWSDCLIWSVSARKAEVFLRDIQPFSLVKARQIAVALAFMEQRRPQGRPWKAQEGTWTGPRFAEEMRTLNGRAPRLQ